jgi:fluoride exporter
VERYLCVLIGGGAGAVLRYMVGSAVAARYSGRFPLGTFLINVTGSFLIGLLMGLFTDRYAVHPNWRLFLVTGVLGGFTTFSSFEYETLIAAQTGALGIGIAYVAGSVGIGFAAAGVGAWVVGRR